MMAKDKKLKNSPDENVSVKNKPEEGLEDREADEAVIENENDTSVDVEVELTETEKLQQKILELEDRLARQVAEFENYKKRTARNYDELIRSASDRILGEILEVVDNFDRALAHANGDSDAKSLEEGMKMIAGQLHTLIGKYDVRPIEAVGKMFDPNLHEALMQVESDEYDEGVVAVEMSRGYQLGDKVLRHSKVGVSKGKKEKE